MPTADELLEMMKPKSNTNTSTNIPVVPKDTTVATETVYAPEVVTVPKKENPTVVKTDSGEKVVSTNDLLVSLIAQARRTNHLLEQMRNIALGHPMIPEDKVVQNGE